MKNQSKPPFNDERIWIILVILFLLVTQILFTIPAPCRWLKAVWEAGDLLSFIGTITLGFISIKQTQLANLSAKEANLTSRKLIDLQTTEYVPSMSITDFIGISKYSLNTCNSCDNADLAVLEMRTDKNEVIICHGIVLTHFPTLPGMQGIYCRNYEVHFEYLCKIPLQEFCINSVSFIGNDFDEEYLIDKHILSSMNSGDKVVLMFFILGESDFMREENYSFKYLVATKIRLNLSLKLMDGRTFLESIEITKHLVRQPESEFNTPYVEFPVSFYYDIKNKEGSHGQTEI